MDHCPQDMEADAPWQAGEPPWPRQSRLSPRWGCSQGCPGSHQSHRQCSRQLPAEGASACGAGAHGADGWRRVPCAVTDGCASLSPIGCGWLGTQAKPCRSPARCGNSALPAPAPRSPHRHSPNSHSPHSHSPPSRPHSHRPHRHRPHSHRPPSRPHRQQLPPGRAWGALPHGCSSTLRCSHPRVLIPGALCLNGFTARGQHRPRPGRKHTISERATNETAPLYLSGPKEGGTESAQTPF